MISQPPPPFDAGRTPIRLLGVSVHNLCSDADLVDPERLPFEPA